MTSKERTPFRAIIVGGSIAGLTLAHAFEQAGIDYELLERRNNIAPNLGATHFIWTNGATILDQLGLWENMKSIMNPMRHTVHTTAPGKSNPTMDHLSLLEARLGYTISVVERRAFLQSLFDQLKNQQNIHVNKDVESVTQTDHGVLMKCRDGSEYHGDIVIGADGVRSKIRTEMQSAAALNKQLNPKDKEGEKLIEKFCKKSRSHTLLKPVVAMSAEFNVLYGVSSALPGFVPGYFHTSRAHGHSIIFFVLKDGRLGWVFTSKIGKKYKGNDIPRCDRSQADAHVQKFPNFEIGNNVKLAELWKNVTSSNFAILEEGFVETWTYGRFICIGDAVHKATTDLGQGALMAMEDAVTLTNTLVKMLDTSSRSTVTDDQIQKALQDCQKSRKPRAKRLIELSNKMAREATYSKVWNKAWMEWVVPHMSDFIANKLSATLTGGPVFKNLPLPKARVESRYEWKLPIVVIKETLLQRALISAPLLLICWGATETLGVTLAQLLPLLQQAAKTSLFHVGDGSTVHIPFNIFRVSSIDGLLKSLVAFFLSSLAGVDPVGRLQAIAFLSDFSVIVAITNIESIRTGNAYTYISIIPTIFLTLSQLRGAGIIMPIYFYLHYLAAPPRNYAATDSRLTNTAYARTLLPALATSYLLPFAAMFFYPDLSTRQYANAIWQCFPIILSITHRALSHTVKNTTKYDRIHNPTADIPSLRITYLVTGLASASVYLYLWTASPYSLREIFFSGLSNPGQTVKAIAPDAAKFLKYDYIATLGAGLYWTGLQLWDLKRAQKTRMGWFKFLGIITTTTVLLGPGAAMAGFWYWREGVLGRKAVRSAGEQEK